MARSLQFSVDGDASGGINAFAALRKEAESTGKALRESMASVSSMSRDLTGVVALMRSLREGATATSRSVRTMGSNLSGVGSKAREVTAALKAQHAEVTKATAALGRQRAEAARVEQSVAATVRQATAMRAGLVAASAQTGVLRAGLMASSVVLSRMATQAALLANRIAYGARAATMAARGGMAGAAQGLQGLGIGFRMSGIAVGNQLANMGGQGLTGLLGGAVGAAAAGAEMAVRLVASFSGMAVRLLGSASNLILAPIGAMVQGLGELVGTTLTKALGGAVSLVAQAAGNLVGAVTNLVGEAVSQVGNIFTGVVEAARGAFQGAVSVASNVLGSLAGVAETVVGKVSGILGTLGKTVLGIAGTLGGFALHDFMDTESGLTKGIVLLDDKLSAGDKKNLRAWAEDLHRQMPTITRDAIGTTFQRIVSTGFSGNLPGAKKATEASLRLQFATEGGGDPSEAARVVAKAFSIYRDELEKFPDPLARISDLLFQTVNAADVSLGDLVSHLGMVLGPAKALGLSLEDLLVMIAKMSRTADVEQTFTGLRRLLLEPLKMSKEATGVLGKYGLAPTTLSSEETGAIRERQKAIADKEAEIRAMEMGKRAAPNASAEAARQRKAALSAAAVDVAKARTPEQRKAAQIALAELRARLDAEAAATGGTGTGASETIKAAKADLAAMKKELAEFEKTSGSVTNMKKFLDDLAKAGISAKELSVIFPDIRALVAAMTMAQQDPQMAAMVESMVKGAAGKTGEAFQEQASTMKVKLLQLWEGLKAPFQATLNSLETPFKGFIDRMIDGLSGLTKWWSKAINHPGAGRLLDSIGSKVGSVFSGLGLGGLSMPGQGDFWRALETGLDKAWSLGTKVVAAFTTLANLIKGLAQESSVLARVWDGMKAAGSWIGSTFDQLSKGSTKNLSDAWNKGKGVVNTLWDGAEKALTPLLKKGENIYKGVVDYANGVFGTISTVFSGFIGALKAVVPLLAAYALAPAARAIGAAFVPPGAVGARGGGSWAGAIGGAWAGSIGGGSGAASVGPGGFGGPGLLRRQRVFMPTIPMPTARPVSPNRSLMSNREWEQYLARGGNEHAYGPMLPSVYGDWKRMPDQMVHQPWAMGRMVGRPDLMGPENDALFNKRGKYEDGGRFGLPKRGERAVQLTPSEAMAFASRYPGGATQRFMPDDAYYASEAFARTRGDGGAVPMSDAERMSRPSSWSWKDRARGALTRFGALPGKAWAGLKRAAGGAAPFAFGMAGGALGGALAETGNPISGGILQGASMGAMGFGVNPFVGMLTTAAGAILGAARGFADSAREAGDHLRNLGTGKEQKYGEMLATDDPAERMRSFFRRSLEVGKEWTSAPEGSEARTVGRAQFDANEQALRGATADTLRAAFAAAKGGDYSSAISMARAAKAYGGREPFVNGQSDTTVGAFEKANGTTLDAKIAEWEAAMAKAAEATKAQAEAVAEAAKQFDILTYQVPSLQNEIESVNKALNDFEDQVGSASDSASSLSEGATTLEQYATDLRAALKMLPEDAKDTAEAMAALAAQATALAATARKTAAQASADAAAGKAVTLLDLFDSVPGLKGAAGRLPAPKSGPEPFSPFSNIFGKPTPLATPVEPAATAAAGALGSAAEAATEASNSLFTFSNAASLAASAVGGGNRLSPEPVEMLGGEARTLRSQLRKEAHRNRNLKHEKFDQFGNKIDPFTGWPSVGDQGGVGWNVREGSGDMGFSGRSMYGHGIKFKKPEGKAANDDGTPYLPSAVGPNGALAPVAAAAKGTENAAKGAGTAARDAANAITGTGKAMTDVAGSAKSIAATAREGVAVTRQAVATLHEEDIKIKNDIAALRDSISALSAGEGAI